VHRATCVMTCLGVLAFGASTAYGEDSGTSPSAALRIVLDTQQDKIKSVDNPDDWWGDTKVRTWSVKRPLAPGRTDTTHSFTVTYGIDGVTKAAWFVDTRAGTALPQPDSP